MRIGVISLLLVSFAVSYRDAYRSIRKPMEPYREAADYLANEGGIWEENALFVGSNEFCALDGFIEYYFEKRGYDAPAHIVDSMVHSEQETRFTPITRRCLWKNCSPMTEFIVCGFTWAWTRHWNICLRKII